ncbi:MAG: ACT domain-containing protein [Clostridia bacterium]|nr:ACT domain-containing protein [Clostridia bacterium]
MIVEQISIFVENKMGRLLAISEILAKNNIDISALSLADTEDYGVLRMLVSDPHKAKEVLNQNGIICKVTEVLAVAIDDRPGGFYNSLKILTDNHVDIKYMYACISHEKGKAIMVLRVDDVNGANKLIHDNVKDIVDPSEIYRLSAK